MTVDSNFQDIKQALSVEDMEELLPDLITDLERDDLEGFEIHRVRPSEMENEEEGELVPKPEKMDTLEQLFTQAGYDVTIDNSGVPDYDFWTLVCMKHAGDKMLTFFAYYMPLEKVVDNLLEGITDVAQAQKLTVKSDSDWYYYGNKDGVALFESLGTGNAKVIRDGEEPITAQDPRTADVENFFRNEGYMVLLQPHDDGMEESEEDGIFIIITPLSLGKNAITAGTGTPKWMEVMVPHMRGAAEDQDLDFRHNDTWFYSGHQKEMAMFESVIE